MLLCSRKQHTDSEVMHHLCDTLSPTSGCRAETGCISIPDLLVVAV